MLLYIFGPVLCFSVVLMASVRNAMCHSSVRLWCCYYCSTSHSVSEWFDNLLCPDVVMQ